MTPLRRRMQEELQRRNYSDITAVCYLRHVAEFAKHFGRSLPAKRFSCVLGMFSSLEVQVLRPT